MNIFKKAAATFLVVLFCVAAVLVGRVYLSGPRYGLTARDWARARGNPEAPVWIVEYTDLSSRQCVESGRYLASVAADPLSVFYQVRFLAKDRSALDTVLRFECAARQGKFWPFHDAWLKNQAARINGKKLAECLRRPEIEEAIRDETKKAEALGIRSIPTYFVNGKKVSGLADLKKLFDAKFSWESV